MNVLCIGPHPDDLEFGAAGTLIKFIEAGHDVFLMIMTRGGMGGEADIRTAEQIESGAIIGVKEIFWGGYEDTMLKADAETISVVEKVLGKIEPEIIFCPFGDDTHQDHRTLADVVMSASRNSRNLLLYETPTTSPNFWPNVFVDITQVLDRKVQTLLAHRSQIMKTNIRDTSILDMVTSTANFRGVQGRVQYAEGFVSIRLFLDIP
ncbi:MAG: PIG-L family deacetylase [candidate division Zixibacteria bacterium]|nr:PIG-L family deacetylase [Candidatus Tariuqbacter arcticus]